MPLVTVRVDEETKARMEQLEFVNWSRELRERILEVLDREGRKNRIAALRIMEKLARKPAPGWDSVAFLRETRETRYGPRHRRR